MTKEDLKALAKAVARSNMPRNSDVYADLLVCNICSKGIPEPHYYQRVPKPTGQD